MLRITGRTVLQDRFGSGQPETSGAELRSSDGDGPQPTTLSDGVARCGCPRWVVCYTAALWGGARAMGMAQDVFQLTGRFITCTNIPCA